jgi:hypothetical protein
MCAAREADGAAQSGLPRSAVPAPAYARAFEALLAKESEKQACLGNLAAATMISRRALNFAIVTNRGAGLAVYVPRSGISCSRRTSSASSWWRHSFRKK